MTDFSNGKSSRPLVVGIGGTTRTPSSTDRALRLALRAAEDAGAIVHCFNGPFLVRLPHFAPEHQTRSNEQREMVEMVRRADGLIVASPGYHGGVSGLVKNALDLLEDLSADERSYLDGRAVGLVATAGGWQAAVTTLHALRAIVHALRGWPTPMGAPLNTAEPLFDANGNCSDSKAASALNSVGSQVVEFAVRHNAAPKRTSQGS
ncbi:MAG: NADPH-dependent FMN reductase [Candidatus Acidiferrales bacterium]